MQRNLSDQEQSVEEPSDKPPKIGGTAYLATWERSDVGHSALFVEAKDGRQLAVSYYPCGSILSCSTRARYPVVAGVLGTLFHRGNLHNLIGVPVRGFNNHDPIKDVTRFEGSSPTYVDTIPVPDFDAMVKYHEGFKDDITKGNRKFSLGIGILAPSFNFFVQGAHNLLRCEIKPSLFDPDSDLFPTAEEPIVNAPKKPLILGNCASAVSDHLNAGNVNIDSPRFPMPYDTRQFFIKKGGQLVTDPKQLPKVLRKAKKEGDKLPKPEVVEESLEARLHRKL